MSELFRLAKTLRRDPLVEAWLRESWDERGVIARRWFECLRASGEDVREAMHDGCPTACIGDAAFGYVGVFKHHVNVGFFRGAELPDPAGQLEGTGKRMRHVKIRPEAPPEDGALRELIVSAYQDMKRRLGLAPG